MKVAGTIMNKKRFSTIAIHEGKLKDQFGSLATPIYQTSTHIFDNTLQGGKRFALEEEGYIYSRLGNPTVRTLELRLAALEEGEDCLAFASGMGAISSVFWTILKSGDHVIADGALYGCTFALLSKELTRFNVEISFVNTSNLTEISAALKPNTKILYLETPTNPHLKIADLEAAASIAHQYNSEIIVMCDNTFATPYHTKPLTLGCDLVIHSVTKYLNGHGDVIAGAAIGKKQFLQDLRFIGLKNTTGAVMDPFSAYLVIRGLKTLELRMQKHNQNAQAIVKYLEQHPKVQKVYYPGLPSHPGYEIATKQMKNGYGGMIAFELIGGREAGALLLDNLKIMSLTVSLGSTETLIEHPASMTHTPYTLEELEAIGVSAGLVRLSVGLEDLDDLLEDLKQGLDKI
jgi:methionine-gamma-lyase